MGDLNALNIYKWHQDLEISNGVKHLFSSILLDVDYKWGISRCQIDGGLVAILT
jgi:hypothetical protein